MQHPWNARLKALVAPSALVGLLAACGGAPPAADGVPTPSTVVEPSEQTRPSDDAPAGPSEAELQAEREAAAEGAFAQAAALYSSAAPGQRDLAGVERLLEQALASDPSLAEAWFNIGVVRGEAGDVAGAREAYDQALVLNPQHTRSLANLGYLQMAEEDFAGARQTFEQCVAQSETEPGCNINLAMLYRMGHVPSDDVSGSAIERLRFALGGDARNADAYAMMAQVYDEMGRPELARLVCENAILQGIDAAVLHNRLGLIALQMDDVNVAYQEFQRAVQLDPGLLEAHTNIGAMALSFRDYEAALRALQMVLAERPDDVDVKLSYGVALRGMDRLQEAEAVYREVLAAEPGHLGALFNMALLYQEALADYPSACGFYREFLNQPGASSSERYEDAELRLRNLYDLLTALVDFGEVTAEQAAECAP